MLRAVFLPCQLRVATLPAALLVLRQHQARRLPTLPPPRHLGLVQAQRRL